MSTFEIKLSLVSMLGTSKDLHEIKEIYEWVLEEVEFEETKDNVTKLTPVN